jgi:hypothetical protein
MANRVLLWLAVAMAVATVSLCSWSIYRKVLLEERLSLIEHQLETRPMIATRTWTSDGDTITVNTERKKNTDGTWAETVAAWKARHDTAVAEAAEAFPPDAP